MNKNGHVADSQRERLRQALQTPQTLNCENIEDLLIAFVQAEAAGEDIDQPRFRELSEHLSTCADCLELYEQLTQDLKLLTQGPPAARPAFAAPSFFAPDINRQGKTFNLKIWTASPQTIEIQLPRPQLLAKVAVLKDLSALFSQEVPELTGKPEIAGTATLQGEHVQIRIMISSAEPDQRWRVQLESGAIRLEQITSPAGIVEFEPISRADLSQLTITCTQIAAA
jgi:hypothetical protein